LGPARHEAWPRQVFIRTLWGTRMVVPRRSVGAPKTTGVR
jgi:hypothetical protein